MARRNEDFARLGSHGGYTQALTVGKGFSGAARRDARQQGGASSGRGGGGGGGSGTMNAYARHQELIRNYHRYEMSWFLTCRSIGLVFFGLHFACPCLLVYPGTSTLLVLRYQSNSAKNIRALVRVLTLVVLGFSRGLHIIPRACGIHIEIDENRRAVGT